MLLSSFDAYGDLLDSAYQLILQLRVLSEVRPAVAVSHILLERAGLAPNAFLPRGLLKTAKSRRNCGRVLKEKISRRSMMNCYSHARAWERTVEGGLSERKTC